MINEAGRKLTSGKGIPLRENDIDTDRIIPARFMKSVTFEGMGEFAFYDARFEEDGKEKAHAFNNPAYKKGTILVVNKNFGCGSSREHAPQALMRYGVAAILGESFAEIFQGNCTTMGIPAATMDENSIGELQAMVEKDPSLTIEIDLEKKTVGAGGKVFFLELKESYRKALADGSWDSTAALLARKDAVEALAKTLPYMK
jgi:3-isopropylmalate/(R)-2-methylmalate dehydratase small subunit